MSSEARTTTRSPSVGTHDPEKVAKRLKEAIVVLSDPEANSSDEAFGRVFNALAAAYDFKHRGDDVSVLFQGAGARWIGHLNREDHPAHALFKAVEDTIAGVSCACAEAFGGAEEAEQSGFELLKENLVPGTTGLPSLSKLASQGYSLLIF